MTVRPGLARLHQIAMPVRDIDRAVAFYRDVLGVPLLFTAPPNLAFFDCGGVRLMLSPAQGQERPGTVLYFAVDDIHEMHRVLAARGIAFTAPPARIATLATREVWLAAFADSEGNALALMSEPPLPDAPPE